MRCTFFSRVPAPVAVNGTLRLSCHLLFFILSLGRSYLLPVLISKIAVYLVIWFPSGDRIGVTEPVVAAPTEWYRLIKPDLIPPDQLGSTAIGYVGSTNAAISNQPLLVYL